MKKEHKREIREELEFEDKWHPRVKTFKYSRNKRPVKIRMFGEPNRRLKLIIYRKVKIWKTSY